VANVIIGPDPTNTIPDVILEISYEGGQAYLEHGDLSGELGDPIVGIEQPLAYKRGRSLFKKASFMQGYPCYFCPIRRIAQRPRVRQYVACTWAASAAGMTGCGTVSAFFAGQPFVPCVLGAGTMANTGCGLAALFF
jgi:hypothetical protein